MSSRIEQEIPDVKFRLIPKAEVYSAE